jgi:dCTP diphosphatase
MSTNPAEAFKQLTGGLLKFRSERDWAQFHNPKDQALSLCLEASELMELMQWRNGQELLHHLKKPDIREQLGDELADVLGWVLLIAHDQNIDLAAAFDRKLAKNHAKYPIHKARGKADKYTEYDTRE